MLSSQKSKPHWENYFLYGQVERGRGKAKLEKGRRYTHKRKSVLRYSVYLFAGVFL